MKIRYRQRESSSCGLYAIANVSESDIIFKPERFEEGKSGHTINKLNQYLKEDEHNCYLETIYKSIFSIELPHSVDPFPNDINHVLPLLATVTANEGGINHMISMWVYHDKTVLIFDSLKDDVIETDWVGFRVLYPYCFGLFAFMREEYQGEYVMFDYYKIEKI